MGTNSIFLHDAQEEIGAIDWRNDGKIRSIAHSSGSTGKTIEFGYNP